MDGHTLDFGCCFGFGCERKKKERERKKGRMKEESFFPLSTKIGL